MADDHKRSELICFKVTERMALDLLHLATSQERSTSDLLYVALRTRLYGDIERLEANAAQFTKSDKVNQGAE